MIKYLIVVFFVGLFLGFLLCSFLTISKISSYENRILKLKKNSFRIDLERDDD